MDQHARGLSGQALTPQLCVIGGDGLIGRSLLAAARAAGIEAVGTSRRSAAPPGMVSLDLADPASVDAFALRPRMAFLCAAMTKMKDCEASPAATRKVNVDAAIMLAQRVAASGGHLVFLSTSQVFDGTAAFPCPADAVRPANEYGRQKADAEAGILRTGRAAVARLTKVLSNEMQPIRDWEASLGRGQPIRPFTDLHIAPVSIRFAVDCLLKLGSARYQGVAHISGAADLSYAAFAALYAARLGVSAALVRPTTAREAGIGLPPSSPTTALRMDSFGGLVPQSAAEVAADLVAARRGATLLETPLPQARP